MFWKNGNNRPEGRSRNFKVPSDSRAAFRIAPSPKNPIHLKVAGQNLRIRDISSMGIAFEGGGFKLGTIHPAQFKLPDETLPIFGIIEILKIEIVENINICRAKLYDLTTEQEDQIHRYVLKRQKEALHETKPEDNE